MSAEHEYELTPGRADQQECNASAIWRLVRSVPTNVVDFAGMTRFKHLLESATMVFHIEPIAHMPGCRHTPAGVYPLAR